MSGWSRHTDELASALNALLEAAPPGTPGLQDMDGTLASRDQVVRQLRGLVAALAGAPALRLAAPLTVFDVTHRPAQALHAALCALPAASPVPFTPVPPVGELPDYEQRWQDAATACEGLRVYEAALRELPGEHSWWTLRDLADFCATLAELDGGLAEALRPALTGGAPLALPFAMLTHEAHDAVRVCTAEIRARLLPTGPAEARPASRPAALVDRARGDGPHVLARQVRARGADLSLAELRAVSRLLESGGTDAAVVLERADRVLAGVGAAAAGLREVAACARTLRQSPVRSLGPEQLSIVRASGELQRRLQLLAGIERRLGAAAQPRDLERLAGPAWAFAEQVPLLARELETAVHLALQEHRMVVPAQDPAHLDRGLEWVFTSMTGADSDQPRVLRATCRLGWVAENLGGPALVGERVGPREVTSEQDSVATAAAAARRSAGAARAQLRQALREQQDARVPLLAPTLPAHPRLAPEPPRFTLQR